jgi:hypothetical protein
MIFARLALILAAPLLLLSCVLSPGRFVSSLDIRKDRSFTFSYVGEVILLDPQETFGEGEAAPPSGDGEEGAEAPAAPPPAKPSEPSAEQIAARKAVAEALSREAGYRSVEHVGGNVFKVDYQMTGRLDRSFVYPINIDAKAVIPWIAVETRKDGTVRLKALAFGDPDEGLGSQAKPGKNDSVREGTFTLTTDATLVMQNNEEGLASGPETKVIWRVTPTSSTVPTAVVRF